MWRRQGPTYYEGSCHEVVILPECQTPHGVVEVGIKADFRGLAEPYRVRVDLELSSCHSAKGNQATVHGVSSPPLLEFGENGASMD